MNGYFEEINEDKYLTLVTANERKEIIQKYEELWKKIRDLIRSVTKNWDGYQEKYMKIKFCLNDDLPLNKTIKIYNVTIVVGTVFFKNNKYYPQVFVCLYKL